MATVSMWHGKRLEELSKEELIEAVIQLAEDARRARDALSEVYHARAREWRSVARVVA
jgi:hypothetical protein